MIPQMPTEVDMTHDYLQRVHCSPITPIARAHEIPSFEIWHSELSG